MCWKRSYKKIGKMRRKEVKAWGTLVASMIYCHCLLVIVQHETMMRAEVLILKFE